MARRPPTLNSLIQQALGDGSRPVAFVLAGHNGSGKSSLWKDKLSDRLQMPLINADRLMMSILPEAEDGRPFPTWARKLRDEDERWMKLSQDAVYDVLGRVQGNRMSFAFETVFSYWKRKADGSYDSKHTTILELQRLGYFVVLLFVGLANVEISVLRVSTRVAKGGHAVPQDKLRDRFARTQKAIAHAAPLADMTLMFDNSRTEKDAFSLARAQRQDAVLFDCRDPRFSVDQALREVGVSWLDKVAGIWPS